MRYALAAAVVVGLLAPVAGQADHRPGHNPGGGNQNSVDIKATSPVVWGRSTVITGQVKGPNSANAVVELLADPFPFADNGFTQIASVAADNSGHYRFVHKPQLHTRYYVRAKTSPAVASSATTVLVRIRVKLAVSDSTPNAGRVVRFSGTACPEHDGKLAYIQKRSSSGRFNTVARTTLKDVAGSTCSSYAKGVRIRSDGTYRVIVLSKDQDHMTGVSRRISIDAH